MGSFHLQKFLLTSATLWKIVWKCIGYLAWACFNSQLWRGNSPFPLGILRVSDRIMHTRNPLNVVGVLKSTQRSFLVFSSSTGYHKNKILCHANFASHEFLAPPFFFSQRFADTKECTVNVIIKILDSGLPHFVVSLGWCQSVSGIVDIPEMGLALAYCCQFADAVFENSLITLTLSSDSWKKSCCFQILFQLL